MPSWNTSHIFQQNHRYVRRKHFETSTNQKIISQAIDFISGCKNDKQLKSAQTALNKKTLSADTGGLLKHLILVIGQNYIITTNITVEDGLANGAIGKLVHIKKSDQGEVTRV